MTNRVFLSHRTQLVAAALFTAAGVLMLSITPAAYAELRVTGDYAPADNPNTAAGFIDDPEADNFGEFVGFEGITPYIPFTIDGFNIPPDALPQYTFEEGDVEKVDIEIGRTGYGRMDLDGASILRYGHLIIGGEKEDANAEGSDELDGSTLGDGYVTVSGFGTVYNSEPDLVPSIYALLSDPTPRPTGEGYDVYVGLTGTGNLRVLDGARIEIQDSLQVGVTQTAVGNVVVDGIGSTIDQRGNTQSTNAGGDDRSPTLIGPGGTGTLKVQNGGTVHARGGMGIGSFGVAIAGGDDGGNGRPISGSGGTGSGNGTVEVDGPGSRINSTGGLTVGTFFNDIDDYEGGGGEGTLRIIDSGLLNIAQADEGQGAIADPAGLLVGKSGLVELDGGRIVMADGLLSDGIIRGDGRVNVSTFSNRRFGTFSATDGESLRIVSLGTGLASDDTGSYFLANNGLIDVNEGEVIFDRVFEEEADMFLNRIDPGTTDLSPKNGRIHGQDAVMRFRSGLMNQAVLAFTAGDNTLEGDVINDTTGSILLSGNANAVFLDNLTNLGDIELAPDGTAVSMTVLGTFTGTPASSLSLALGGGPTGSQLNSLVVGGDVVLGGALNVELSANGVSPLDPMPGDEFEIIFGAGELTGAFDTLSLPMLSDAAWSWGIDTSNSDFTLVVLDIIPIGGDFNGDGIVDGADLDIWKTNFGIEMGATGVLGDADGDGDVDGTDYLIWLTQVGGAPVPVPGALVAGGDFGAAVPEPSSVLLLMGGVLAGTWFCRRK